MGRVAIVVAALGCAWALLAVPLASARPQDVAWPQLAFTVVATGLSLPTQVTHAADGSGRLFVTEQAGRIRIISGGTVLSTPFLDIASRVRFDGAGAERGLLSVAFPPGYATNGWFYVNYTSVAGRTGPGGVSIGTGDTVVSRFRLLSANVADPNSEEILLVVHQPHANHNGGQIVFAPDGLLYIGMGDGGSAGDPSNYALQRRTTTPGGQPCASCRLLGKMLRVDVETPALQGRTGYDIPASNPVIAGVRDEIWAFGLRNPWRFSFDRARADLYIGDVGQHNWEEVNFAPASSPGGENYQWACREGNAEYRLERCPPGPVGPGQPDGGNPPFFIYSHALGGAVTGGFVYRGTAYPRMHGLYFFADYGGRIWGAVRENGFWRVQVLHNPNPSVSTSISSWGEDESGGLYIADHLGGRVLAVADPTGPLPTAAAQIRVPFAAARASGGW